MGNPRTVREPSSHTSTMAKVDKKEPHVVMPPDARELELVKLVFGDMDGLHDNLQNVDSLYDDESADEGLADIDSGDESDDGALQDDDLFFIDDAAPGDAPMEVDSSDEEASDSDDAWHDSDDDNVTVSLIDLNRLKKLRKYDGDDSVSGRAFTHRLRAQFEKIYPRPKWADALEAPKEVDSDDEQESEDENPTIDLAALLENTNKFSVTRGLKLISPTRLDISRLKDANALKKSKGPVHAVMFHPTHPLLLAGGMDRTVRIYNIDGTNNPFVTLIHTRDAPVALAQFAPVREVAPGIELSTLVYMAGRRRYMNKWDVVSGDVEKILRLYGHEEHQKLFEYFKISPKGSYIGLTGGQGWCNLLNPAGQWARGFKIGGNVVDLAFSHDESLLLVANTAGDIWEFSLDGSHASAEGANVNTVVRQWHDDGVDLSKIALGGPQDRWVAVGSRLGIVNVYDRKKLVADIAAGISPKPIRSIENLVNPILTLQFSPDGQLLVIASKNARDALRIVNLPLAKVYPNWPTSGTPLGRVLSVAFSPDNAMLAIANELGKVTLWRLNHY